MYGLRDKRKPDLKKKEIGMGSKGGRNEMNRLEILIHKTE